MLWQACFLDSSICHILAGSACLPARILAVTSLFLKVGFCLRLFRCCCWWKPALLRRQTVVPLYVHNIFAYIRQDASIFESRSFSHFLTVNILRCSHLILAVSSSKMSLTVDALYIWGSSFFRVQCLPETSLRLACSCSELSRLSS